MTASTCRASRATLVEYLARNLSSCFAGAAPTLAPPAGARYRPPLCALSVNDPSYAAGRLKSSAGPL